MWYIYIMGYSVQFSSVAQSYLTLCDPMNCSTPGLPVHHQLPDSRPSSQWCHPAISSSVVPFFSCPQSLPASKSFPMSQLLPWGGQSTGVSALASFLPKKSQGWFPLEWTGWISLQSKGLPRIFSNTTVQKHQFFGAQPSSQSNSHCLRSHQIFRSPGSTHTGKQSLYPLSQGPHLPQHLPWSLLYK